MAHADHIREKAIRLRRTKGLTIDEIADRLALPRTTVYYWVRSLEIPRKPGTVVFGSPGHPATLGRHKGNLAMQARWRKVRRDAYDLGVAEFEHLSVDPTFRDFVCMYIGEGYKRDRNQVSICNSDPSVIKLAQRWITTFAYNRVAYSVQHHADQSLDELRIFWSDLLSIDPSAVKFQRKSNSNQLKGRRWRSRYGVLTVRTADTRFRARLQAWIDLVQSDWR